MRLKTVVLSIISAGLLASVSWAGEQGALKDLKARESYSLGYQFGRNVAGQEVKIDEEVLVAALRAGFEGRKPVLSQTEMNVYLRKLNRTVLVRQEQQARGQAAKNLEEAKTYLAANKRREGVMTLPSGLQYRVIREGRGAGPKMTDGVRVRYRGTLVNGTEFDNAMDLADSELPVIPVPDVNKGWAEALLLMKPGSKWQLFIPPQLGYGDRQFGRIPPNSVLIYELELLSVVDRTAADKDVMSGQASAAKSPDSERPESVQEKKE